MSQAPTPRHDGAASANLAALRAARVVARDAEAGTRVAPGVRIRRLRTDDRARFNRAIETSERELSAFMPLRESGESLDEAFDRHLRVAMACELNGRAWRRIAVHNDGRVAGGVCLNGIQFGIENSAEATVWVATGSAGEGLGRALLRAALSHAFAARPAGLGLTRVDGLIQRGNAGAKRIAGSCGFRAADGDRRVEIRIDGAWIAHELWSAAAPAEPGDAAIEVSAAPLRRSLARLLAAEHAGTHAARHTD